MTDERALPLSGKSLAFSPDGLVIAAGAETGEILLYGIGEPEPVSRFMGHRGGVNGLEFSADGGLLYSAGEDSLIRAWEVPGMRQMKAFTATKDGKAWHEPR